MAKTIEEWVKTEVNKLKRKGISQISSLYFHRDPTRPVIIDNEKFYSPADGTILYQKIVEDCNEPIVEIKGINYTLKDVMDDETFEKPCLIIGIFLSFYDVHIVRIPYGGLVKYKEVEAIESYNMPMLSMEKDIIKKIVNLDNMDYIKNNERMIVDIYSPMLGYKYHMTLIADMDVDVIQPYSLTQNDVFEQNSRGFSIKYGSQVELILPLDERYEFELLQKDHMHVEAAVDPLIHLHRKHEGKYLNF